MRPLVCAALLLASIPAAGLAQGQDPNAPPPPPPDAGPSQATPPPAEPPPSRAPPPPPAYEPGQAQAPAVPPPQAAVPPGQWVYTGQYGWLWIPHDRQYVSVPADPQLFPEEYVYYPVYGWRWVVAPWVYGYGPEPRWGPGGVRLFAWWGHPWFRVGGYWGWGGYRGWGPYRGWIGPRVWGPRGWARAPAYYRSGVGERRAVPERHEREHLRGERRGHGHGR